MLKSIAMAPLYTRAVNGMFKTVRNSTSQWEQKRICKYTLVYINIHKHSCNGILYSNEKDLMLSYFVTP